jgi:hypothetical protein
MRRRDTLTCGNERCRTAGAVVRPVPPLPQERGPAQCAPGLSRRRGPVSGCRPACVQPHLLLSRCPLGPVGRKCHAARGPQGLTAPRAATGDLPHGSRTGSAGVRPPSAGTSRRGHGVTLRRGSGDSHYGNFCAAGRDRAVRARGAPARRPAAVRGRSVRPDAVPARGANPVGAGGDPRPRPGRAPGRPRPPGDRAQEPVRQPRLRAAPRGRLGRREPVPARPVLRAHHQAGAHGPAPVGGRDVVMWDNRSTVHYANRDHGDQRRVVHRIMLRGEQSIGPTGA